MATPISGQITVAGVDSWSRVPEIAKLALLEPDEARLCVLYFKLKKKIRRVHDPEYDVQERRPRGRTTTFTGAHNNSTTTLTVGSTAHITKYDYLIAPTTGETFHVRSVDSATQLTVQSRGTVGGSAATYSGGELLVRTRRAMGEGFTAPGSYVTGLDKVTNFAGITSTPIKWTKTLLKTWSQISASQMASRKEADREAMSIEHIRELDTSLLLDKKASWTDVDGNTCRSTNGFYNIVSTNKYTHTGALAVTEDEFVDNVIRPPFKYGSKVDKWGLTSLKFMGTMERWGKDRLKLNEVLSQTLGFEVFDYVCSGGRVKVVHHPGLDISYYEDSFAIFDLRYTGIAVHRDTELQENIGDKKDDAVLDQWLTEAGFSYQYEETCGLGLKLHGA